MNTTQHIAAVRDVLDETLLPNVAGKKYTDEEILRHTDLQVRQLFRTLVSLTKEYHNFIICRRKEDARQVMANAWEWRLPSWISNVARVYEVLGLSGANETTVSPYLYPLVASMRFGREIEKEAPDLRVEHWSWQGRHTLRIASLAAPIDIVLFVAKLPPRMFRVKLESPSESKSVIYLPVSPEKSAGGYDLEPGVYVNSDMQCTMTNAAQSMNYGQVSRVIYSDPVALVSNTRTHVLHFDWPLPSMPEAGDIFESMLPVPYEHARYLQLLVANACAQKKNGEVLEALKDDLAKETALFMEYANNPRDFNGPGKRMIEGRLAVDPRSKDRSY